ncbi:hypothetical protein FOH10_32300 [Nocardia otitidiscaviarum]|uniref:Uncharacterized protein n=1 Tax=Nocardia otitidiscaviarum TaxID=1823 RepID=A0A516NV23_9NOCA|nr:hypothetical protein [Nocardia otitidiscaviarum]MCP9622135.1 hypothetical protein [Nocardia otitidiscaviarum]QDP82714.1 hypothetical protein FOH10_32300 [Nocardia otitidiscaviarum]
MSDGGVDPAAGQRPTGRGDPAVTHEQYLRAFRHPGVSREQLHDLLDAVNAFLDSITPREGEYVPRGGWAPESTALAFRIGRAVEQVLAERDAAERERRRRREIRDRLVTALDAVLDCLRVLPDLAETEVNLGTTAINEGFQVFEDGSVRTTRAQERGADMGALELRRAELDEQMTDAVARRTGLMNETADVLRERLGVAPDGVGIPWVITAAARGGLDIVEPFEFAAHHLPTSPLRELVVQLVADIELARTLEDETPLLGGDAVTGDDANAE